ncbi:anti-sigma factor [Numidum massiliense]|uniref:anti-sigma factor n=1 Tax=Numidum massiliense TaxID=1522315 RepID=UPI0006D52C62|nr:zf-HC2 domain-containing protein [Numidum massiliense]
MTCRDVDRYIQLYVDQEISEAERRHLLEHTRTCPECRSELREMVALVSSLEDIRQDIRPETPVFLRGFLKWVAVCTVVVSFATVFPLTKFFFSGRGNDTATQPMQHAVTVLAAQGEQLHIPSGDYVHVVRPSKLEKGDLHALDREGAKMEAALVYPSAMPYFMKEKREWSDLASRFVFVAVPDEQTLMSLLAYIGAKIDKSAALTDVTYPTSVMVDFDEQLEYETFQFPESKRDIADWFENLSAPVSTEAAH